MDVVNQRLFSCSVLAVALAASSCGINQQSRFQTSFLPPAPHSEATAADIEPPPVEAKPNLYLKDMPAVLTGMPSVPLPRTRGDLLVQRAERRFEAGKKSYQAKDIPAARRDFDSAIDAMLEASDLNPADRQEYEAKLEEMVDAIHRFDLAGMGSAASLEQGKFEKAPLEDILQMTFPVDPKLKDRVKEQVAATVSQLPLSVTDAVLGYINYFSNRGRRTLLA